MFDRTNTIIFVLLIIASGIMFYFGLTADDEEYVTNNQLSKQIEVLTEKVNHLEKLLDGLSKKE